MSNWLFLPLSLLVPVFQGRPLLALQLSSPFPRPFLGTSGLNADTDSLGPYLGLVLVPWRLGCGDLTYWCHGSSDVNRSQVSFQECWEGKGWLEETSQENGHRSRKYGQGLGKYRCNVQADLKLMMWAGLELTFLLS